MANDLGFKEIKEMGFDFKDEASEYKNKQDENYVWGSDTILGEKKSLIDLDPEEIVRLAGDPLPEDQRNNCPDCKAVISKDAKRCEWCGNEL